MNIINFTPIESLVGGFLIGGATILLMLFNGKIAGISGISKGLLLKLERTEKIWRAFFILGMVLGGFLAIYFLPESTAKLNSITLYQAILGGLLVGFGTALGNGCTSGHGICGLSRKSGRSLFATLTFIGTGMVTVFVISNFIGV